MEMITIIGYIGAFLLLLAYFLLIHKNLTSRSKTYQWLNIIGALFLATYTFTIKAYPSLLINVIWFLIGLYGIFHIIKHNRKKVKSKRNVP